MNELFHSRSRWLEITRSRGVRVNENTREKRVSRLTYVRAIFDITDSVIGLSYPISHGLRHAPVDQKTV